MAEQVSSGEHHLDNDSREQVMAAINRLVFVRESHPQIDVAVVDGVVTVTGVVISEIIRKAVLWAASTTPDVKKVVDELHTDTELRTAVARALGADPTLAGRRIFVTTYQGVVTLVGQVASREERKAAAKAASEIRGVRSVVADLSVAA